MDNVNNPNHYKLDGLNGVEVKDVIKSVLGDDITSFYIGNVIKYVLRYKKKNGVEDLRKARLYLDWAIRDYHLGLKVKPEMLTKLLENTTRYTADGRTSTFVYTDPDTNQTVKMDVDPEVLRTKGLVEDALEDRSDYNDRYDAYILAQVYKEEREKEEEKGE